MPFIQWNYLSSVVIVFTKMPCHKKVLPKNRTARDMVNPPVSEGRGREEAVWEGIPLGAVQGTPLKDL